MENNVSTEHEHQHGGRGKGEEGETTVHVSFHQKRLTKLPGRKGEVCVGRGMTFFLGTPPTQRNPEPVRSSVLDPHS